jgi:hypothetical protein
MLGPLKSEGKVALADGKFWAAILLLFVAGALTAGAFSLAGGGEVTGSSAPAWVLYAHMIFTVDFAVGWLSIRRFARWDEGSEASGGTVPKLVLRIFLTLVAAELLLAALVLGAYLGGWIFLPGAEAGGDFPLGAQAQSSGDAGIYLFRYTAVAALTVVSAAGVGAGLAVSTGSLLLAAGLGTGLWLISAISVYAPWKLASLLYFQLYGIPRWLAGTVDFPVFLLFLVPLAYATVGWSTVLWSVVDREERSEEI